MDYLRKLEPRTFRFHQYDRGFHAHDHTPDAVVSARSRGAGLHRTRRT